MSVISRPSTIPAFFWRTMPQEVQEDLCALAATETLLPSGSRFICPENVNAESDWDVYGCGKTNRILEVASSRGFKQGGSRFPGSTSMYSATGHLNLIWFHVMQEFSEFRAATAVCAMLGGPIEKHARVQIFESIKSSFFNPVRDGIVSQLQVSADVLEESECAMCEPLRELAVSLSIYRQLPWPDYKGIPF